ncbi:MAG: MCP four helix bundle domain-containing protein [Candidatus Aquicultor sp.]
MKPKVRIKVIIGIAVAALLITLAGGYSVFAASKQTTQSYPPVIEKLVQAFGLDRSKVDKVLGDFKQEREVQHKAMLEQKLSQDVKDGKITAKQKDAILKKMDELQNEMKNKMETFKALTPEERRQAMEKQRTELQAWAKENSLDLNQLGFLFGGHMRGGRGRGFGGPPGFGGFGPGHFNPSDTSTPPAAPAGYQGPPQEL